MDLDGLPCEEVDDVASDLAPIGCAPMTVRAVVFDVFGTLVDWRSGVARAFAASGLPADPEELADDWRSRYVPITTAVNRGVRPWGDFDELHLDTLESLLEERSLVLPAEARRGLVRAWRELEPWPDVRTGLEDLHRSCVTATLSNGHVALLVDLARHGDLRFDCVFSAELVRAYKPAAELYALPARLLDLREDEVMLAATHPLDLRAAREAGLRTAFLHRPLEYGPGSPPREDPEADVSVSDVGALAAWLETRG